MASNVFTKKEILQQLASKGYFIDVYTLDAFFSKKKIEAIFEDSQGNEFYDQKAINTVLEGLFSVAQSNSQALLEKPETVSVNNSSAVQIQNTSVNDTPLSLDNSNFKLDDSETVDILNNIYLSDGSALINKMHDIQNADITPEDMISSINTQEEKQKTDEAQNNIQPEQNSDFNSIQNYTTSSGPQELYDIQPNTGIQNQNTNLEDNSGQYSAQNSDFVAPQANDIFSKNDLFDSSREEIFSSDVPIDNDGASNFDDITLLSESFEAQEKLRQYVVSELSKKNLDVTPQQQTASSLNNEFKLDISERTLNMIARTMAKKIAKYVGSIMAADAKQSSKVAEFQEENRRLTQKTRELEEQNRKLRLLLAESNKNLNSYKPSIFGLYKKVDPKQTKK